MSTLDQRRDEVRKILRTHADAVSRARRLYFDKESYALAGKQEIEFSVKSAIAQQYKVPFRSVVFTGSAQLGFSAHKDTEFELGRSDLDVACIDGGLFQYLWAEVLSCTSAFSDLSRFYKPQHADFLKDQLLRRGMILISNLPRCRARTEAKQFLDGLGTNYRSHFASITLAVYCSEYAFCWKQNSALSLILGDNRAK